MTDYLSLGYSANVMHQSEKLKFSTELRAKQNKLPKGLCDLLTLLKICKEPQVVFQEAAKEIMRFFIEKEKNLSSTQKDIHLFI